MSLNTIYYRFCSDYPYYRIQFSGPDVSREDIEDYLRRVSGIPKKEQRKRITFIIRGDDNTHYDTPNDKIPAGKKLEVRRMFHNLT